ncbi:IclR family transcriptional regulator [Noviherbaspirillum sedimenti]|uniref:IclR family transcriptional regulator n=1 Tax=Noviherbaspirillum sedimenti TaxID=2320865 RepID=A0A3A3G5Y9_9BURK|nr:IclR family transcriptional regulator [Noviherbaspirillum sedimenti]RJG03085.1 IclR family transcriptional regulator [Noviherbaspirillum sedimenti]
MGAIVPAAVRTFAVFEIFAREKRELLKSELARFLNLPESSCSDLLSTLEELNYVSRTVSTKRYYPTNRLQAIANAISEHDEFDTLGDKAIALLAERTAETCYMAELDQMEGRIIAAHEGSHSLRYVVQVGDRVAVHATAIGKSLLGQLPAAECGQLLRLNPLRALTASTKTKPDALERELAEGKLRGWHQAIQEGREGLSSFAVAGWIGRRLVGISITGPSDRLEANRETYIDHLLAVGLQAFGAAEADAFADEKNDEGSACQQSQG